MPRLRSKYGAIKTTVDGIVFDSKKEAVRYCELKRLMGMGKIRKLELQPKFDLVVNGVKVCYYRADFSYDELDEEHVKKGGSKYWNPVIEDVKGMKTSIYRLKAKLMKACLGITVKET